MDTHSANSFTHRAARLVGNARAFGMNPRTTRFYADGTIFGASTGAGSVTGEIDFSYTVDKAVVIQAPLSPVVAKIVVDFALGVFCCHA